MQFKGPRKCSECEGPLTGSFEKHPFESQKEVSVKEKVTLPDRNNPENVITSFQSKKVLQKPAVVCLGCYEDLTTEPTGPVAFAGIVDGQTVVQRME